MTTPPPGGQLLEQFCEAWRKAAEDCLKTLRSQERQLAALREALAHETDRADYWHARAVNRGPVILPSDQIPAHQAAALLGPNKAE